MPYYNCPVCGFDKMARPPQGFYICPSCGVEFELDDYEVSHAELRQKWIESGMVWFSDATRPPADWNPVDQLKRAGLWSESYVPSAQKVLPVQVSHRITISIANSASVGQRMGSIRLNYSPLQRGPATLETAA